MCSSDHEITLDPDIAEAMEIDSHNASLETSSQSPNSPEGDDEDGNDSALDAEIASLTDDLHTLALEAQRELYAQPLRTQQKLTSQTRDLYTSYAQHGSMIRLSTQLHKFLTAPIPLSTDTKNTMKIWSAEEVSILNDMDPSTTIPSLTASTFEGLCAASDGTTMTPAGKKVSYTNDPESTMIIYENEFHPADMKITFPNGLDIPHEFMSSINNILLLENSAAQAKLRYMVGKYCLPGPGMEGGHPHALPILRLGISSAVSASLSSIFETAATNEFGLTPESRTLLRQAYAAQGGRVSDTEIAWLARSLRVGEDVVREWWEEEDSKRRGEKMMTIWTTARDIEREKWYKDRGMY